MKHARYIMENILSGPTPVSLNNVSEQTISFFTCITSIFPVR